MKQQKLLKTIVLALLALGGVSSAWADTFTPTADVFFRSKLSTGDNPTYSWDTDYPKSASSDNNTFKGNHYAGMFVLQKYTVDDLSHATAMTLTLTGPSGVDALSVWAYYGDWSTSSEAPTLVAALNTIMGCDLNVKGTTTQTALVDGTSTNKDVATGVYQRTFTISAAGLTAIKSGATSNTFTLVITSKTADWNPSGSSATDRNFYSSGHATESYRPFITVTYDNPITNTTTSNNYTDLKTAYEAATTGETLRLNHDFSVGTFSAITNKTLTIVPNSGKDIVITRTATANPIFRLNSDGSASLTIDGSENGASITIDDNNINATQNIIEADGNATVNLKSITFKNSKTSATSGMVYCKGTASLTLEDVAFEDCSPTYSEVKAVNNNLTLKGNNTFTNCSTNINVEGATITISGANASHTTPISIMITGNRNTPKELILGTTQVSKYRIVTPGWELYASNSDVKARSWLSTTYELTVTSAGMSTLVLPFNASIPTQNKSGADKTVTAYKLTTTSNVVSAASVASITAGEPVLIVADAGTYVFTSTGGNADYSGSTKDLQSGALIGAYITVDAADGNYVLQNGSDGVGFYKLVASSNHVINPFRAYLSSAENAAARMAIVFEDGETTGINEVSSSKIQVSGSDYYDLSGRRVAQPTKGLYIVNGKKVIIK